MPLWKQLLTPSIVFPNLRDVVFVGLGFVQSIVKLLRYRPDVVFTKGGFVCLPVGYAAALLNIPLVIHDSDAHPGLTNRLLAKYATVIGTGSPLEYYSYPQEISHYVGIPVDASFTPRSADEKRAIKQQLGFDESYPLTVITGGGLGAVRINNAVLASLDELTRVSSVLLLSGKAQYEELRTRAAGSDRFKLEAFISHGMADILGAADVVIARAGATTLLELAAVAAPTIIIPNGLLTGGHQLKNAKVYEDAGAVVVLEENVLEKDPLLLAQNVIELLGSNEKRARMSTAFAQFARPEAAKDMARLIVAAIRK